MEGLASPGKQDPIAAAQSLCVRLLAQRPRTTAQLAQAMRQRNISDETVETVLARLGAAHLIDDAVFAQNWVLSRQAHKGLAKRVLAEELRERGVAEELIEKACAQLSDETEEHTARELVTRRIRSMRGLPAETQARRLHAYLARRGYSPNLAGRVVSELLYSEEL